MHWQEARSTLLARMLGMPRVGIVSDFDGTLSPIVDERGAAQIVPGIRPLLKGLHSRMALVAVVSGRAVADLRSRVALPELTYIGNHGLERWIDGAVRPLAAAEAYRPALESILRELHPGVDVEDKGATLSVHYRLARDPQGMAETLAPVLQELAARHGLRLSQGKMVFELKPPIDVNKGTTFRDLVAHFELDGALFLGDDTTDTDAMRAAQTMRAAGGCFALSIAVESAEMPPEVRDHADLLASDPFDVEAFLGWVLDFISRSAS